MTYSNSDIRGRLFVAMLGDEDYAYLAAHYDMTESTMREWNDTEWCEFLGCGTDELPYYLLGDDTIYVEQEDEFNQERRVNRSVWDEEDEVDLGAWEGAIDTSFLERPLSLTTSTGSAQFRHGIGTGRLSDNYYSAGTRNRFNNTHYGSSYSYMGGWPSTRGMRPEDIPHHFESVR